MISKFSQVFPLFGKGSSFLQNGRENYSLENAKNDRLGSPSLNVSTDRKAYRPGDSIVVTIVVRTGKFSCDSDEQIDQVEDCETAYQIDDLVVQFKGIEKLDPQWIVRQKPLPGSRHKRGEHIITDSTPVSIASNVVLKQGCNKSYVIYTTLPKAIPPTFKGSVVRYFYYFVVTVQGRHAMFKHDKDVEHLQPNKLESRVQLNVWPSPNDANSMSDELQDKLQLTDNDSECIWPHHMEIFFKEKDSLVWSQGNEINSVTEDGHAGNHHRQESISSEHSLLQSPLTTPRNSLYADKSAFGSFRVSSPLSPSLSKGRCEAETENGMQLESNNIETTNEVSTSDTFVRGRSYNIRLDDQILVRFSPKNSDAIYYFGDTIGGVLTFFHDSGSRRCTEVSVTLEYLESINANSVHPSRKQSPVITKIQSEYHEVVADLVNAQFMFSIPLDGPMSFVSNHITLKWILRFEFITTSKYVEPEYEHPLMVDEREKSEWILPITVCSPLPRVNASFTRKEKHFSPNGIWINSLQSGQIDQNSSLLSGWENSNSIGETSDFGG
eukprot:TRINITY_DN11197_c0_g1_i2.p1 TRINITY_DN11197_c0_g1~~TRINITY_DN11197_c0_g1_i2.p1  ORF type:complete len:553 (-),score=84.58 TRINITY_DN11197_c0_g1_i2:366-2024(-)